MSIIMSRPAKVDGFNSEKWGTSNMIGSLNGPLCIYLIGQILYNLVSGRGTINVPTKFENESVKGI